MSTLATLRIALKADTAAFTAGMEKVKAESAAAMADAKGSMGGFASFGKGALLGVVGAAVLVGGASIKMAGDFQQSATQLVTTAGETQGNLKMVSNGILDMAGSVGESAQTLVSGMYTVESAGFHGADGLTVLKAAAQGAREEGAQVSTMADALTSALNAYAAPASQSATYTSQFIAAVAAGKMRLEDFAGSLSAVLPVAAAAHISFAQVGGAVATMTAQGMSAQQATQDLANTIRSLQSPNAEAIKVMEQLGLSSVDVSANLGKRGLTGTMDLLTDAIAKHMGPAGLVILDTFKKSQSAAKDAQIEFGKLPASLKDIAKSYMDGDVTQKEWRKTLMSLPVGQRELAQQFANTVNHSRGFNDALKSGRPDAQTFAGLLGQLTGGATGLNTALLLTGDHAGTFKSNVDAINKSTKDASGNVKGWSDIQGNLNFQIDQVKDGVGAWAIRLGTQLIPMVTATIAGARNLAGWLQQHSLVMKIVAGVIAAILVPAILTYIVQQTIAGALTVKNFVMMQVQAYASAVRVAASFLLMAGAAIVNAAAMALAWIIAFWPVILVIGIVIAVGVLLITHWSQVKEVAGIVARAIGGFFSGVGSAVHRLISAIGGFFSSLGATVHKFFDALAAWWAVWGKLVILILTLPFALIEIALYAIWARIGDKVLAVFGAIKAFFVTVWGDISGAVTAVVGALATWLGDRWKDIQNVASTVWNAISGTAKTIWGAITGAISGPMNGLKSLLGGVWNGIKKDAEGVWNGLVTSAGNIFGAIGGAIQGALSKIHIPLPHISVTAHPVNLPPPIGTVNVPDPSISWYGSGGIFDRPQIIGVGERGKEVVAPVDRLPELLREAGGVGGANAEDLKAIRGYLAALLQRVEQGADITGIEQKLVSLLDRAQRHNRKGLRLGMAPAS